MTEAPTALRHPMTLERQVLKWDAPRLLLVAANAIGGLYILASVLGWWTIAGREIFDYVNFEALILVANLLFFRSALAQPGRWRRPWLLVSAGLFAALLGSLVSIVYGAILGRYRRPHGPTSSSWPSTHSSPRG